MDRERGTKQQRHFDKVKTYRDRFTKETSEVLRKRLAGGTLYKEAAIAIREVLTERGEIPG